MAEPYDTINAITDGLLVGPYRWWRFSDASGGVSDEGTAAIATDLVEDSSFNTFTMEYQYEANPAGDGYGMLLNGGGQLEAAGLGLSNKGTFVCVFRRIGTVNYPTFWAGFYFGFDSRYIHFGVSNADGTVRWQVQDSGANDEYWDTDVGGFNDLNAHSVIVVPGADTTTSPTIYMDGVAVPVTHTSGDDGVNDNYWWDSFATSACIGGRGGVNDRSIENVVMYEMLTYDFKVDATQALQIHNALIPGSVFRTKSQRRRNRRLFADYVSI